MQQNEKSARTAAAPAPKAELIFGRSLKLEGVSSLIGSDDKKISVALDNSTLSVEGEGMRVDAFDSDAGTATIVGSVRSLKLSSSPDVKGVLSRLFK